MKYYIIKTANKNVYLSLEDSKTYKFYAARDDFSTTEIDYILLSFICKIYDINTKIVGRKLWTII